LDSSALGLSNASTLGHCVGDNFWCQTHAAQTSATKCTAGGGGCEWIEILTSPSFVGECLGQRDFEKCSGSSYTVCRHYEESGLDCEWWNMFSPATAGRCMGSDARCEDKAYPVCMYFKSKNIKCDWYNWVDEDRKGVCMGNNGDCTTLTYPMCKYMGSMGNSNCKWFDEIAEASSGECIGASQLCWKNDKRYCEYQKTMGAPCEWRSFAASGSAALPPPLSTPLSTSSGQCQGNDSRCSERKTSETCNVGDCRWKPQPPSGSSSGGSSSGACVGNDSRCSGRTTQATCNIGDCKWKVQEAGTSTPGRCIGNDSRCRGRSNSECSTGGVDCEWIPTQVTPSFSGQCLGNDNRCMGSDFTMCNYWADRGADCVWYNMAGVRKSGRCVGNDSRCKGKAKPFCDYLADTDIKPWSADCTWDSWVGEDDVGECLGQSENCRYQPAPMCKYVSRIDHGDCKWFAESPGASSKGECIGNDNACSGSSRSWCDFHAGNGRPCTWYSTKDLESSRGHCSGNNPRCGNISKQMCEFLSMYHGAGCQWNDATPETLPSTTPATPEARQPTPASPCLRFCGLTNLRETGEWCNSKNGNQAACLQSYLFDNGTSIVCAYEASSNRCKSTGSTNSVSCPNLASLCQSSALEASSGRTGHLRR